MAELFLITNIGQKFSILHVYVCAHVALNSCQGRGVTGL